MIASERERERREDAVGSRLTIVISTVTPHGPLGLRVPGPLGLRGKYK